MPAGNPGPGLAQLPILDSPDEIAPRAAELVAEPKQRAHSRTSRLFTILMLVQWVAGIVASLWISPRT
jgi:hypothetical protein